MKKQGLLAFLILISWVDQGFARDIEYKDGEVSVYVAPGEPTQVQFPGTISGGFKRKQSSLSLDRKEGDLIIFASETLADNGEAIIVRLMDGRSYSMRVLRASQENPRDPTLKVKDDRGSLVAAADEEDPGYKERKYQVAPSSTVAGLMREMVLVAEFGKQSVAGYRISDRYSGQPVLNDGTILATVDKIFIGPNYWGYVVNAQNTLDTNQRINPATFRLDGTRAISINNWELAARPMNIEQQIAAKDKTKIYIITRAKGSK